MTHRANKLEYPLSSDSAHFVACICGDAVDDNTFKYIDMDEFIPNMVSKSVDDKVHQLYFREMVDHDYSFDHDFYQFMLKLMSYDHLTARTVFDVLIKPPGKTVPLLHSKSEMIPGQVFHDWCYQSDIQKRLKTGLDQEEIDLIKSHNFEPILRNYLMEGYFDVFDKFEEIFPTPSHQIDLGDQKLMGVPEPGPLVDVE